ncbi:MAG: zinc ABC transporter solute-binding protein [Deltaproteobacteria bacterium]|nr:zinc ABC transporter solute-binding protein [Deltaproteobacteria bacterium]
MKKVLLCLLTLICFQKQGFAETKLQVTVSIQPQVFFLEKIGGDHLKINLLVPAGRNPATYSPTPIQIAKLVKSKLYFRIGMPFEKSLLPKIKNIAKNTRIIETQAGIKRRNLAAHHHEDEDDHGGDDKDHNEHADQKPGNDPHIWLNPLLVKVQAETIVKALSEYDPSRAADYQSNTLKFISELDQLHLRLKTLLTPLAGKSIYVFHPSYGYFTDEYGLKQVAIEFEGKRPKARELAKFIKMAKKEQVQIIFVQPQFDRSTAKKIAGAINGDVIILDPMAKEYLKNLENMAAKIVKGIGLNVKAGN